MITVRETNPKNAFSYEAIVRSLFENYESLYDIDAQTSAYQCYYESDSYSELQIAGSGEDFFTSLSSHVSRVIHPEDRDYVLRMLRRDTVLTALERGKYYSFVYRLLLDGKPVYHKVRATLELVEGRPHILLGIRNVDETIRQEQLHTEALASMYQKEKNHMEAIMASAAGYLEVNLTQDRVLDLSPHLPSGDSATSITFPMPPGPRRYSDMNRWLCEYQILEEREHYEQISAREHLLMCFERGEKRASVSFSARKHNGDTQPCREVFYLYQDHVSEDIMAFCVIYDLTEEQRREKERQELENALQMSRIRNSTSQMQPHFLYNALASIQEIILDDPAYAADLIGDFTVHLRSCVRAMASDAPIPFVQELENIRAYVNIEKMRFGRKLRVELDAPVTDFQILPLSVQPLVENAIRHGIYERGARGGTVTVRTRERSDAFLVEVEDDGVGFDAGAFHPDMPAGQKDSTGLRNIIFRLDKVMHAHVDIRSTPGLGTKVVITIPKGGANGESDHCR